MTSYQLFTQTTVESLTKAITTYLPTIGTWMADKIDIIVFIHSFAWIFLLSSVIPAFLLGKQRGVLVQFGLCLTLAFLAFVIQDLLTGFGALDQILRLAQVFHNPVLAAAYLSVPYLLMIGFDIKSRRTNLQWIKVPKIENETDDFPEDTFILEEDSEPEKIKNKNRHNRTKCKPPTKAPA
jgi:hypothetical protein